MHDMSIEEELEAFRQSARKFLEREVVPNLDAYRTNQRVPKDVWLKAGEAGLLGASIPVDYGGSGGDFRHEVVIMEELGRIGFLDFGIPLHNAIVAPYITRYCSEDQKQR